MALLSKTGPSGVSNTGTYTTKNQTNHTKYTLTNRICLHKKEIKPTFPMGFISRNLGLLLDTPISKFFTSSTLTPVYSAAISALKPFLLVFPACNT